ncbi:carbonic anhydrase 2-like isoform X2 [Tachysurus fulvidraco]|uniref:carbonic anhydrase 2-like isoform X2 n=1 Tax=Tachysurus fulvidraco TaxID=1234273 RepID=UPI000F4DC124|nr:carbonic anhydrase 2-like isoform X2 [Tachysurus fulvidraco]XP_047655783.1 carbonic anhydrase 2-like isoform X2 [Tachysurus fulvidraco]
MESWIPALLSVLILNPFRTSAHKGPYQWVKSFPSCITKDSTLHSPINLKHDAISNNSINPLDLRDFAVRQSSWTVRNARDTVVVEFQAGMSVKGGSINHNYRIVEMRFHWGSNITNGSEHKLDGRRFPMEMQIVGVAPGFADVEAASANQSGLLMLGVFIDIASAENKAFKALSHAVSNVMYPGDSFNVTPPALSDLLPEDHKFYQYNGGQTVPPCLQTVTWIVFEKPIFISREQYLPFVTRLYYTDKSDTAKKLLVENYRFIQPSLNRQIFVSSAVKIDSASAPAPASAPASTAALNQHASIILLLILISTMP